MDHPKPNFLAILLRCKTGLFKHWFLTAYVIVFLFCYLSVYIPPALFWPGIFASYAIPAIPIFSIVLMLVLLPIRSKLIAFPLIVLIAGIPFVLITYSIQSPTEPEKMGLSVLSFNAKLFRAYKTYGQFSDEVIQWSVSDTSDIKCFQEYSTNPQWDLLNVTRRIDDGGYQHFIFTAQVKGSEHNPGMAIFSKYPILDSGFVWKNKGTTNAGIYMDIVKNQDTVRIYNVHLESMYLKLSEFKSFNKYPQKIMALITSLKNGAKSRTWQINKIIEHTENSPYPVIICGDFNETPYSYNYMQLRSVFSNTFENAGNGFGFTFNSVLFFLRIDHQFYGRDIEAKYYHIDRSIRTSDHFPTRALYRIRR